MMQICRPIISSGRESLLDLDRKNLGNRSGPQ